MTYPVVAHWRTSSRSLSFGFRQGEEITCFLQDKGFEPLRIAALAPQASPLTTWVILLASTGNRTQVNRLEICYSTTELLMLQHSVHQEFFTKLKRNSET